MSVQGSQESIVSGVISGELSWRSVFQQGFSCFTSLVKGSVYVLMAVEAM